MSKLRDFCTCSLLSFVLTSTVQARLPDIGKADLIQAVRFADSLHTNVECKFTVNDLRNKAMYERRGKPVKRELEIHWRKEGVREYIDVTVEDGRLYSGGKPFRVVEAFNGEGRKQWVPNAKSGDIFNKAYEHAWSVPIDYGMTLGRRDKKLGEALSECEITTLRQEECNGHDCYFVEAAGPDGSRAQVWIDPEIGWRARSIRYWGSDGLIWHEASADYKDCGNGVWFPVEGVFKLYGNDPSSGKRVVGIERRLKVEQVTINKELTQEDFDIKFPEGTRVYDHIYGIGYVIGATSLKGVDDAVLDEIAEAALKDQSSGNATPDDKETAQSEAADTSGMEQTNEESADPNQVAPIGSGTVSRNSHPWLPLCLILSTGLLVVVVSMSRRKGA